jgi:hypothetical protein
VGLAISYVKFGKIRFKTRRKYFHFLLVQGLLKKRTICQNVQKSFKTYLKITYGFNNKVAATEGPKRSYCKIGGTFVEHTIITIQASNILGPVEGSRASTLKHTIRNKRLEQCSH